MTDRIVPLSLLDQPDDGPQPGAALTLPVPDGWPAPPELAVYHGLAGEIVQTIAPETEADPVAILSQLLVSFGAAVGRGAFFQVEATRHHPNEFLVLIGDSARARKGSSWDHVHRLITGADTTITGRILTGLSSGEGLIHSVRDPTGQDPGASDRRLLVIEPEFVSVLKNVSREISTLSPTLRSAWDGRPLAILTRTAPARATDAHISVIGHITATELRAHVNPVELANGLLNRFLLLGCRRVRLLPEGGDPDPLKSTGLDSRLQATLHNARRAGQIGLSTPARHTWTDAYHSSPNPSQGSPARSAPAPKRTRSASRSSTRCSTTTGRSDRRTSPPRSRSGTTRCAQRPGRWSAPPQTRSPDRSTPRSSTSSPAD